MTYEHGYKITGPGGASMKYDYGDESWDVTVPGKYVARFYDEETARWFVNNYAA